MLGVAATLVWVTPSDQVSVQGAVPVRAAWMLVKAPEQIVPPPVTAAVGNGLTTCASTADVLLLKLVLPLYEAVSELVPTDKAALVYAAWPALRLLVASETAPFLKVTVPVGDPDPGATTATDAVKITCWPEQEGLSEEINAVEVLALLTVCVIAG